MLPAVKWERLPPVQGPFFFKTWVICEQISRCLWVCVSCTCACVCARTCKYIYWDETKQDKREGDCRASIFWACKTVSPILLSSKSFPVEQGDDYLTARGKRGDYISFGGGDVDLRLMEFFLSQPPNNGWVRSMWWSTLSVFRVLTRRNLCTSMVVLSLSLEGQRSRMHGEKKAILYLLDNRRLNPLARYPDLETPLYC